MSQDNLTARYRPQTFAQVVGQEAVKRILSRTAASERIAPAYLFSGTRGVGKTTLARVFAKALNCQNGPALEPCNQCSACRQITQGAAVDVVEIDGASNTGVDNVRRLKEDVGYAPLECRYKIIIIDEAHMLSKQAFNALLKTLEEPPGHVVFIMATTEVEKFPQTVISRCQHFVFKRLSQPELVRHLAEILDREAVSAEEGVLNLLARRGAGSVRDAMSLLAQILALGTTPLTIADVRDVLGLAGGEIFIRMATCVAQRDILGLHALLNEVLDQGLDLGFFLRELAACWRNLFLLHQLGDKARSVIDLPAEELDLWANLTPRFTLAHLHAAWQMTQDSQRRILTSVEPALGLELLLLNLAYLPDLLALSSSTIPASGTRVSTVAQPAPPRYEAVSPHAQSSAQSFVQARTRPTPPAAASQAPRRATVAPQPEPRPAQNLQPTGEQTWAGFVKFCKHQSQGNARSVPALEQASGEIQGHELILGGKGYFCERLKASLPRLEELAKAYFGPATTVRVDTPVQEVRKTRSELKEMALADSVVREAQERFGARIMEIRPTEENNS